MKMECVYCGTILKTEVTLKNHQKTAKYCLAKQNKTSEYEHKCCFCEASFTLKSLLYKHLKTCKSNIPLIQLQHLVEKSYKLYFDKKQLQNTSCPTEFAKERSLISDDTVFFNKPIKSKRILDESQKVRSEYLLSFDEKFHRECIKASLSDIWV
jgi:hypothetical protein